MNLLRLTGKGGVQIYDCTYWEYEEARMDYRDITGFDPDENHDLYTFDVLGENEFITWIKTGETE